MSDEQASPPATTSEQAKEARRNRRLFVALVATTFVVAPVVTVASLRARRVTPPPVLSTLPAFALTDQAQRPFGTVQMAGRPWVANFIFTTCPTICPRLTERMAGLARLAAHAAPELRFVSFSVDPERDTPEVLATYGRKHGADFDRWTFVTGPLAGVETAVTEGFKIGLSREKSGDFWEIVHGEHFVLVDRSGAIRGYYSATDEGMGKLLEEARQL